MATDGQAGWDPGLLTLKRVPLLFLINTLPQRQLAAWSLGPGPLWCAGRATFTPSNSPAPYPVPPKKEPKGLRTAPKLTIGDRP